MMSSSFSEIYQWAESLPDWEKVAFEKIAAGRPMTELDYEEALQILLEDAGVREKVRSRPVFKFAQSQTTSSATAAQSAITLMAISDLQNVNALVSNQRLSFNEQLTVIYGANGSGKSGYARVLGCAGFSRGDQEILPDVIQGGSPSLERRATLLIHDGEQLQTIDFQVGTSCQELSAFYTFDSTSVQIHLTQEDTLSFSPYGLSWLTRLVVVTDECRKRLQEHLRSWRQPHNFGTLFHGTSEVTQLISQLGPKTKLKDVEKLGQLSEEEKERLQTLERSINQLSAHATQARRQSLQQTITDLQKLRTQIERVLSKLNLSTCEQLRTALRDLRERQENAQNLSLERFQTPHLESVGRKSWRDLIGAAYVMAQEETSQAGSYPRAGDYCLLCQQPLEKEAHELLGNLWLFLTEDAQAKVRQAQLQLQTLQKQIIDVDLSFFGPTHTAYRYLEQNHLKLMQAIEEFTQSAKQFRQQLLQGISASGDVIAAPLPAQVVTELNCLIDELNKECDQLASQNPQEELRRLEAEKTPLWHRQILSQCLPQIIEYIQNYKKAEEAIKFAKDSKHISRKQSDLFKQLVTDRYIGMFSDLLRSMGRNLKVQIQTRASKGKTLRQLVLKPDSDSLSTKVQPDKVLSEGEKRAVALADFLTEVALDEGSRGIILDDPVTSLDAEWKEIVARHLVKEAQRRQVIIFTHDMHFMYLLKEYAGEEAIQIASHWIRKEGGRPGYVYCDNSPMKDREYRKPTKAENYLERAEKTTPPDEQHNLLQQGFNALRTTYEAFTIYDLFNDVVQRWGERISLDRLREVAWDTTIINDLNARYGQLCRYMEGHLHSDAFAASPLTTTQLKEEIAEFRKLKERLQQAKKQKRLENKTQA